MACSLSSHVLDTTLGTPGRNMRVTLHAQQPDGSFVQLFEGRTCDDGRIKGDEYPKVEQGKVYKITFHTKAYFESVNVEHYFFPYVDVVFVPAAPGHFHVPLLISPYQYSTYRGS